MHLRLLAPLAFSALLAAAQPAAAQTVMPASCPAAKTLAKLNAPLARTSARLRAGEKVVIVAIGSSSTAGAGASVPDAAYPNRLQAMLRERFPAADISVVNRGINGQDAPEMLARFDTDVAALKPTLVIWQSGVNALFREGGLAAADALLHEAIARVKAIDADLVLVDPQYAPRVLADADSGPMVNLIAKVAAEEGVAVYPRFALMRDWHEKASMGFESFLWKDQFHMNDWGYNCFARDLGRAVVANIDSQQRSADVGAPAKPIAAQSVTAKPIAAPAALPVSASAAP
ncbi:SGNH/GDSL hydrolase family protein [Ancylobacter vacuolatus]|uniref:Lysophospholipase L1-like esterase n=1 Tax=Ancylobacter vacuolatus TaxID=223389 RepID=A0ABU0DLM2_9HYPH|nr:SGNH/GDSL hydrolase family protein [Ancylobacter vacuolatus]MDQ0349332.1 lysophospholipase L1-like esterase [Ancylobacter vacuolatus]